MAKFAGREIEVRGRQFFVNGCRAFIPEPGPNDNLYTMTRKIAKMYNKRRDLDSYSALEVFGFTMNGTDYIYRKGGMKSKLNVMEAPRAEYGTIDPPKGCELPPRRDSAQYGYVVTGHFMVKLEATYLSGPYWNEENKDDTNRVSASQCDEALERAKPKGKLHEFVPQTVIGYNFPNEVVESDGFYFSWYYYDLLCRQGGLRVFVEERSYAAGGAIGGALVDSQGEIVGALIQCAEP